MTLVATRSRGERLRAPLGVAAAIGVGTLALRLRDPHQHASWGLCPFKAITGWDCPGCGGLRAVNDLTHGDLVGAWHSNALFVTSVPLLLAVWVVWVARRAADRPDPVGPRVRPVLLTALAVVAVAFAVYRNTPWGSALYAS